MKVTIELPDFPEIPGKRFEYLGKGVSELPKGATQYAYCNTAMDVWLVQPTSKPNGNEKIHYAAIYEAPKPTTLADLVGEDGQKQVWLHQPSGYSCRPTYIAKDSSGVIKVQIRHGMLGTLLAALTKSGYRWSHSPFTPYDEANEFVV